MTLGKALGVYLRRTKLSSVSASGVEFTDDLTDGAGTPVAITTSIATRQAFQRGRSNIVLDGTYDVVGGDPTGMAWRVGSGSWQQFASETIGSNNWQGTLNIPSNYAAQGTLEVKPINGLNVTPAQVADLTVSDIIGILGQSNIDSATNKQTVPSLTYSWRNLDETNGWTNLTTDNWGTTPGGSFGPFFAEAIDNSGIPPVTYLIEHVNGTGFITNHWNPGDSIYEGANSRLTTELANTGGLRAIMCIFGEADAGNSQTEAGWESAADAFVDDLILDNPELANTKFLWPVLGEQLAAGNTDDVRNGIIDIADTDSRVIEGPSLLGFDWGDNLHYGTVGGAIDAAAATAQLQDVGKLYYRAAFEVTGSPPEITSATFSGSQITVTFDRDLENHTDTTGWSATDGAGARTISSAAQGASANIVVLTVDQALTGSVTVDFGLGNSHVGSTLREATAVAGVKSPVQFAEAVAVSGTGASEAGQPIGLLLALTKAS